MGDLLLRNVDPDLKRRIAEQARQSGRSLSDEAKALIKRGLPAGRTRDDKIPLGTWLASLIPPDLRTDDIEFERRDDLPEPPPDLT
jgi:plasmid stability protein